MKKKNMIKLLGFLLIGANLLAPANAFAAEMSSADTSGVQEVPTPRLEELDPEVQEQMRRDMEWIKSNQERDAELAAQGQAEWEAMYGKHDEPAQSTENTAPAESAPTESAPAPAPAPATNNVSQPAETTTSVPSVQAPSNDTTNVAEPKDVKKQTKNDSDAKDKETQKSAKEKDSEKVSDRDKTTPAYKVDTTDPSRLVDDAEIPNNPKADDSKKGGIVVAVFEKVGDTWKCIAAGVRDACSNAIDWFFGLWK